MKQRYLLFFTLVFLLQATGVFAQREFWGTGRPSNSSVIITGYEEYSGPYGWIYKTDKNGENIELVHRFDTAQGGGRFPRSGLLLASNGKLYGTTVQGASDGGGVLYEYDLILDTFRVVVNLGPYTNTYTQIHNRIIEARPGLIIGGSGTSIFAYDIDLDQLYQLTQLPFYPGGSNSLTDPPWRKNVHGIYKSASGDLYTPVAGYTTCPTIRPSNPTISKLDPHTGNLTTLYTNPCLQGILSDAFVERGNVLYSIVSYYGANKGIISSFDISTNTYQDLHHFQGGAGGDQPTSMIAANNDLFYGSTTEGGTPGVSRGTLFKFDPANNQFEIIYEFPANIVSEKNFRLKQSENGKLYGTAINGIFEYDTETETFRMSAPTPSHFNFNSLLEICRKPFYKYYAVTSHTLCEGTPFVHDLRTLNSETIVWRKDNVVRTDQTGSVLSFDAITLADGGLWQAELTNECGTTYPPAIHITVNTAGGAVTSVITPGGTPGMCPGTSLTLSGNNGGVWNTGETTPTISVSQPGTYQVTNTNSCGTTYSNIVTVDTIHIPLAVISMPNRKFCDGDSLWITSNVTGVWNTGVTADSIRVPAVAGASYSLTSTNQCRTDVSNTLVISPQAVYPSEPIPAISPSGDVRLCRGQNLAVSSNFPQNPSSNYTWTWLRIIGQNVTSLASSTPSYTVTNSGVYVLRQRTPCGKIFYSDTLRVTVDEAPPSAPVVTASGPLSFCPSESVTLQSSNPNVVWSTGATTSSITVNTSGTYTATASNGCGQSTSVPVVVTSSTSVPLTNVSWSGTYASVCLSSASPIALGGGSPAGGSYSGNGVSGTTFDPTLAGVGNHTLTYTYTNGYGCSGTATKTIRVDTDPVPPSLVYGINSQGFVGDHAEICEGTEIVILASPSLPGGVWNTGSTDPFIFPEQTGIYTYTFSNSCGTAASVSFDLTVNPKPVVSYTQIPDEVCREIGPIMLSSATPAGGTYTGAGVTGNIFNSLVAGMGLHTITYSYTDAKGCSAQVDQQINVYTDTVSIIPLSTTTFCEGGSVLLSSTQHSNLYWSNGLTHTPIEVTESGTYTVTYMGPCGVTVSQPIVVTVRPAPEVEYVQSPNAICASGSSLPLSAATPSGGTYTGTGVTGNSFNPSVAGQGVHTVTYSYTDGNGCTAQVDQQITVLSDTVSIVPLSATTFCEGGSVLLSSTQHSNLQWSNGLTHTPIEVTESGTYTVTYTGPCGVSVSEPIVVTVRPAPEVEYVQLPDEACASGSLLPLSVATPSGGTYTGTGVTGNSFNPSVAGQGVHTITYSYTDGNGCTAQVDQQITVLSDTVSIVPLSATTFCEGGSVLLSSTQHSNLQWSNGLTHTPIEVTESGTYTVTYTGPCGVSVSEPIVVTVRPAPEVEYVQSPDEVCASGSLVPLSVASPAGGTYTGTGVTGSNFNPAVAGQGVHTITYSYTDGNGCTGSATQQIQVIQPSAPVITFANDTLFSTPAHSYQWYLNGLIIPGATGSFYVPTEDGVYTVETTNAAGCNATSAAYNHQSIGIAERSSAIEIELYPNPTSGAFTLVSLSSPIKEVRIYNALGQLVYSLGEKPETILVLRLQDNGMYLVHITTEQGTVTKRLVVSY